MRITKLVLIALFVAVPIFGQSSAPPPEAVLREVLQLSDEQMNGLKQLQEARRATVEPLMPGLAQAQQALAAALNADPADPATIGKAMLAVRDLQRKIEQAQHGFVDGFIALLTDEQRQQVEHIRALDMALRAGQALHAIGF